MSNEVVMTVDLQRELTQSIPRELEFTVAEVGLSGFNFWKDKL